LIGATRGVCLTTKAHLLFNGGTDPVVSTATTSEATFARGIHPPEEKHLAEGMPIEILPTPASVMIPLLQHIGAPCEACVEAKQEVAIGDKVGEATSFISSPVHASIDGKTKKATVATLPNGRHVKVIPIKAAAEQSISGQDLFDDVFGGEWPRDGLDAYEPDAISKAALEAGVVGLGGAAFPSHVKLARNEETPIEYLLINGCECEPYLTADYRLMVEVPEAIITGTLLAKHATGAKEAIIGIENNKPKAIAALRKAAEGTGVEVRSLKTKYPQGAERQLTTAMIGREVPTLGLPLQVGAVVQNVGTVAAIARAVLRGKALTHRVITVTGAGIREPKNLLVPIGVSYQELIDYCGGMTEDAARVVSGGPMMGFTVGHLSAPVTKGTSGITVLTHEDVKKSEETACIRCGRCVDACPLNLVPTKIALASRAGNAEVAETYYLQACVECGCCAYVCPASIPLVQLVRIGKIMLSNK